MKKLGQLFLSFRYGGLTAQELAMCIPEIRKRNGAMLKWVLLLMMAALGILLILSLIPDSGEESNRSLYIGFFLILCAEFAFYNLFRVKWPHRMLIMNYIFMTTAYVFGIFEATCLGQDSSSTVFCVFLVAIPMLVIDIPLRLSILTIVVEVLLLVVYFWVGNKDGDPFVVVNSLSCTFLGICCGYIIQKTKLSDIRNHLMLEVQRDTDMMTGACSRVAYIRDLGGMGEKGVSAGVIFADINGLKKANDTLGHEAGDRLIKEGFCQMMRYFSEDSDRIYRIGGDEFVIISLGEEEKSFRSRFEKMTSDKDSAGILSCGFIWLEKVKDAESAVKEAEKMMYAEKEKFYRSHPEKDRRSR
ncbi:MAG: GGDEF domain-containing protein [Eubacterium sp.]|nr:GGDEF domain-containing protein [Eubacterium sp.]